LSGNPAGARRQAYKDKSEKKVTAEISICTKAMGKPGQGDDVNSYERTAVKQPQKED